MTFEQFRFPLAVLQAFRKRSLNDAVEMALRHARGPVTRDEAINWVFYLKEAYKRENFDDIRVR